MICFIRIGIWDTLTYEGLIPAGNGQTGYNFDLFTCTQRHLSGLWAHGWSVLPHVMVGSATAMWVVTEAYPMHQSSTIPWMMAVVLRMIWYIYNTRLYGVL